MSYDVADVFFFCCIHVVFYVKHVYNSIIFPVKHRFASGNEFLNNNNDHKSKYTQAECKYLALPTMFPLRGASAALLRSCRAGRPTVALAPLLFWNAVDSFFFPLKAKKNENKATSGMGFLRK